jgi:L-malate glycosyltransferase
MRSAISRSAPPEAASAAARPVLAFVTNSLDPGGTERLVVDMGLAFNRDFRVHVFCLDGPGLWAAELEEQGIPVRCLRRRPGLDLRLPWKLAKCLRACGAHLVHAHQVTPWFYSALSRLLYPRPNLLLEEHGRFFPEVDKRLRQLINRLLIRRLTHRFVAVSEDMKQRLRRYEGLDAAQIQVVYNGVTLEPRLGAAERAALRRELGFQPEDFVVGTVGRFDPVKNLPMLVRSLAAARARESRVRGLLIGDGAEMAAVRALVGELGLAESVRLTGYRRDARRIVQCLDLFVLSSFSEGASIALLEAAAAGVPVAATDVGGNPEIIVRDETGWIVPSGSVDALQAVILEAAADPARCARYAESGLRRLEDRFSFAHMLEQYRQLYRSLLASPRRVRSGANGSRARA